jgi:hypothetical protein
MSMFANDAALFRFEQRSGGEEITRRGAVDRNRGRDQRFLLFLRAALLLVATLSKTTT